MKDLYSLKQIDFLLENSEELPPLDEIEITDNYSISYALFILILNGIEILLLIHIVLEIMHVYSELDRTTVILIVIVGIIGVLINYILEIRKINNDEKQKN